MANKALTSRRTTMFPHADTLFELAIIRTDELQATAERERLAALAGDNPWPPAAFATVVPFVTRARAWLASVAKTAMVTPRRGRPALLPEQT
jgi:hypothetical protein